VVVLRGELDLMTGPAADRMLEEAAQNHPGCDLLIDLRDVTFADCAGLRSLARAARRARERGGTVTAAVGDPRLRRLLVLTRVAEIVRMLPPLDALAPGAVPDSAPGPPSRLFRPPLPAHAVRSSISSVA
jgi:anti-sigma B factor antagonist